MARINIEDSLFNDPRFLILRSMVDSEVTAIGKLVVAWKTAQAYWLKGELIPVRFWELLKLDEIVDAGFAEIKDDGVYVKGTEEQFAWLKQKQEAGKKSGESRREKRTADERERTCVERNRTDVERNTNAGERKGNGDEPLTLTPTLTQDKTEGRVTTDAIINLFNEKLAGKGRIERFKGHFFPGEMLGMFLNTSGSPEFSKMEQWEEYFKLVASRKKLLSYPATLKFLIKHDNALEILNGGYQDKQEATKPVLNGNQDVVAMSERIYSTVISHGMTVKDFQEVKKKLSATENKALENFGSVRDIHENQLTEQVKRRLRDACVKAMSEQQARTG